METCFVRYKGLSPRSASLYTRVMLPIAHSLPKYEHECNGSITKMRFKWKKRKIPKGNIQVSFSL